ncbi:MAG: AMP-binding protein [Aliivibrio sp.]|uniref:olefin beta-lactone synthetase n=1 Tax=Aliivibrio sp. TaxID=1872443 RepID=UPI001A4ADDD5|nr:AMP-binding protein [Aliivibrio sp.]
MSEKQHRTANLCRHLKQATIDAPNDLAVAVQSSHRLIPFSAKNFRYQELNFSQLDQQSDAIAHLLNDYGIKKGMKAVLMVTPSLDFFALTFALFKAGIIPILVDPGMGVKNLKQCFIEAQPDAFIGVVKAQIARAIFSWGKSSIKHVITVTNGGKLTRFAMDMLLAGDSLASLKCKYDHDEPYPMVMLADDEMAAILFTSGSTGTPKGVVYSHRMFEAQIEVLKTDYQIENGERDLATFPLFSLFGPALGMASIIPDMDASKPITADPATLFAAIDHYQCSNLFANPALIEVLGKAGVTDQHIHQLPTLKRVISAGAPATIASITHFSKMLTSGIEVLNSYGATESLPLTKIASSDLLTTTDITDAGGGICVGLPVDGVEIAIIEITEKPIQVWSDALTVPAKSIGEIVVKGPMVSRQYYRRDQATVAAKIVDGEQIRHRMGDLGYIDDMGKLWMCGRKAHRVECDGVGSVLDRMTYFSIPTERIFNVHPLVRRSALVGVTMNTLKRPLICIELHSAATAQQQDELFSQLTEIAEQHAYTQGISEFLVHADFPVDIRHNAKIFREKLAIWAQEIVNKRG